MSRALIAAYGFLAYAAFVGSFLYAIGFLAGAIVPKTVDSGPDAAIGMAVLIDVGLLLIFAIQHTIMARPAFKARFNRLFPEAAERSTFVIAASACLGLLYLLWRPIHGNVWHVESPVARWSLIAVSLVGWGTVLYSSFLIDHFDLFGLRQVVLNLRGKEYSQRPFMVRSLYRFLRHPLMLGFIIAFWFTPTMTWGHLLFSAVATAYILFGIHVEERDLQRSLGEDYRRYRERTPMLLPWPR